MPDEPICGETLYRTIIFMISWFVQRTFIFKQKKDEDIKMLKYLKIHWIGCLYSILLIGFTVYMFMDTFFDFKSVSLGREDRRTEYYSREK